MDGSGDPNVTQDEGEGIEIDGKIWTPEELRATFDKIAGDMRSALVERGSTPLSLRNVPGMTPWPISPMTREELVESERITGMPPVTDEEKLNTAAELLFGRRRCADGPVQTASMWEAIRQKEDELFVSSGFSDDSFLDEFNKYKEGLAQKALKKKKRAEGAAGDDSDENDDDDDDKDDGNDDDKNKRQPRKRKRPAWRNIAVDSKTILIPYSSITQDEHKKCIQYMYSDNSTKGGSSSDGSSSDARLLMKRLRAEQRYYRMSMFSHARMHKISNYNTIHWKVEAAFNILAERGRRRVLECMPRIWNLAGICQVDAAHTETNQTHGRCKMFFVSNIPEVVGGATNPRLQRLLRVSHDDEEALAMIQVHRSFAKTQGEACQGEASDDLLPTKSRLPEVSEDPTIMRFRDTLVASSQPPPPNDVRTFVALSGSAFTRIAATAMMTAAHDSIIRGIDDHEMPGRATTAEHVLPPTLPGSLEWEIPVTLTSISNPTGRDGSRGEDSCTHTRCVFLNKPLFSRSWTTREKQRVVMKKALAGAAVSISHKATTTLTSSANAQQQQQQRGDGEKNATAQYTHWKLSDSSLAASSSTSAGNMAFDVVIRNRASMCDASCGGGDVCIDAKMEYLYDQDKKIKEESAKATGLSSFVRRKKYFEEMTFDEKIRYWSSLFVRQRVVYRDAEPGGPQQPEFVAPSLLLSHVTPGNTRGPKLVRQLELRLNGDDDIFASSCSVNDALYDYGLGAGSDVGSGIGNLTTRECVGLEPHRAFGLLQQIVKELTRVKYDDGQYLLVKARKDATIRIYRASAPRADDELQPAEILVDNDDTKLPPLTIESAEPAEYELMTAELGTPKVCNLHVTREGSTTMASTEFPYACPHWTTPHQRMYTSQTGLQDAEGNADSDNTADVCKIIPVTTIPFTYMPRKHISVFPEFRYCHEFANSGACAAGEKCRFQHVSYWYIWARARRSELCRQQQEQERKDREV